MAKQFHGVLAGACALIVISSESVAFADSEARPMTYKIITRGEKYVFVMIAPLPVERDAQYWNEETAAGIRVIRRVYTRSGLYRNDGSTQLLWTVDWYAHGVEVASDGVHLIRFGPWPWLPSDEAITSKKLETEALSFFANGKLIRTYSIGEFVDDATKLPRSVSHFQWMEDGFFNDAKMEYTLKTHDGNTFVIDVNTGPIVSETRLARQRRWYSAAGLGLGAMAVFAIVWESRRLKKRAKMANARTQQDNEQ